MPKLYFELRPPLAQSCTTTLFEKPILLIFTLNRCSTEVAVLLTPDPAKMPRATELEYAKEVVPVHFELPFWDNAAASWRDAASKSSIVAGVRVLLKMSCSDSCA
jgi:hypothetical protein